MTIAKKIQLEVIDYLIDNFDEELRKDDIYAIFTLFRAIGEISKTTEKLYLASPSQYPVYFRFGGVELTLAALISVIEHNLYITLDQKRCAEIFLKDNNAFPLDKFDWNRLSEDVDILRIMFEEDSF